MEHPLTLHRELNIGIIVCLNPCSNGIPSDETGDCDDPDNPNVLIPVLMEYPLTF